MRYWTIRPGFYLVEQTISKNKPTVQDTALNHIWIYDRSGSMAGLLSGLANDLIERAKTLPIGDTITLGWFSGEGTFNFILKGYKISGDRDYKILEETINKNKTTIGSTCFSEILIDTDQVLKDLSTISENFALCFFTDGYPIVSNYSREIESIHMAIAEIQGKLASSLLVGYGNYYNKELMSQMAEHLGGTLIHSENLAGFKTHFSSFVEDARENGCKKMVTLEAAPSFGVVFGLNGKQIVLYQALRGNISFTPTKGRGDDYIYITAKKVPAGAVEVQMIPLKPNDMMVRAAYAAAYTFTQRTKTDLALEILGALGDKALIDATTNAFTNAEYGRVEALLQQATFNPMTRFKGGRQENYLPPSDAFCLLDVLKYLMNDDAAFFYPNDPSFQYKRIGAGAKVQGTYPRFEMDPAAKCPLNALTWNDTKLNLSIRAQIEGTVELQGDYAKHGFNRIFPTFVYRNYALVKDGFLNIDVLPVSISQASFDRFVKEGLIDHFAPNGVHLLNLDRVPVINRKIADGKTSATALCTLALSEVKLEAQIKALGYLKGMLDPEGTAQYGKSVLTKDQELFLEPNGIGRNGYAPPVEKLPATDFYMAKEFAIKIKGLSSLPKVGDVIEKSEKGGNLTPGMQLIKAGLDLYESKLRKNASDKSKLEWLDGAIVDFKSDLMAVRSEIQEAKFAVILGKRWFDEFTSRENNTLSIEGYDFTITVDEVRVEV